MVCEDCRGCPIKDLCDEIDKITEGRLTNAGRHDILAAIYNKGRADERVDGITALIKANAEPEPKVDWSKIEVDTKLLVRRSEKDEWKPRYFAKYENREVYVYSHGSTSHTARSTCKYRYVKLYEGEQI